VRFVELSKLSAPICHIFGPIFDLKFQWPKELPDLFGGSLLNKLVENLGKIHGANHGLVQQLRDTLVTGLESQQGEDCRRVQDILNLPVHGALPRDVPVLIPQTRAFLSAEAWKRIPGLGVVPGRAY
jgi:hypothetical protein